MREWFWTAFQFVGGVFAAISAIAAINADSPAWWIAFLISTAMASLALLLDD